jgi:iron complex outermembrane recepter protein
MINDSILSYTSSAKTYIANTLVCCAMIFPVQASADLLEEVVVTAQKRSQNLQDIGIAITAFSGDQLRSLSIFDTVELANQTPGLIFTQAGGSSLSGLPSIRGVSQNDFGSHQETPNAVYIDDVYVSNLSAISSLMFDTERVEVLKGPQGTLFGRNATGGLMHIITNKPTNETEGYVDVAVGSYNQFRVEAAIGGALSETVSARVSGIYNVNDGWMENEIGEDIIDDDTTAMRVHVQFNPTDDLQILLTGNYYKLDDINAGAAYVEGASLDADLRGIRRPDLPTDSLVGGSYFDSDGDPYTGAWGFDGSLSRDATSFTIDLDYTISDKLSLTSITNTSSVELKYFEDNDLSPTDITRFRQGTDTDQFSQELQLNYSNESLSWLMGVYYLDIDGDYFRGFGVPAFGVDADTPYSLKTESWAVFTQAEFSLSDQLKLTSGIRWTEDKKDFTLSSTCDVIPATVIALDCGPVGFPTLPGNLFDLGTVSDSLSEGDWSGRLELDWTPSDDTLVYVSWSRGIKGGGFNAPLDGSLTASELPFKGEVLTAYEIGLKQTFWGDKARFNTGVFYYDYEDYQSFDQRGLTLIVRNKDARIYGMDAELTLEPGHGISALFGMSLLDTVVYDTQLPSGRLVDTKAPQAPSYSVNMVLAKDWGVNWWSKQSTIRAQFDANYTDDLQAAAVNSPATAIDSNLLANARISYIDASERFEFSLFSKNVFDEEMRVYAFDLSLLGYIENNYTAPRWFGASIKYNFF